MSQDNLNLNELDAASAAAADADAKQVRTAKDLDAVYDVPVQVSAVLGRAQMQVSSLLKLGRGAVIELDRKVGEAIDIYVNNRLVARGEVVVVEDRLGITMREIIRGECNWGLGAGGWGLGVYFAFPSPEPRAPNPVIYRD